MKSGGLFAGYGGLDMAIAEVFGATPAWFSEIDDAPTKILAHHWPGVPNLGDITKVDWGSVERVDVMGGGFPCQDVSTAGKRAGMQPGNRSGLWSYFAFGISKLRPRYVVIENVRGLLSAEAHSDVELCPWCLGDGPGEPALRALGAVLADLAELGYDARWCGLRASDVGAPHPRFRLFVLAADTHRAGREQHGRPVAVPAELTATQHGGHLVANPNSADLREQPVSLSRGGGPTLTGLAGEASPNPEGNGWDEGWPESAGQFGGSDAPECSPSAAVWGGYGPAIEQWERALGRVAPAPTEPNSKDAQRLS